MDTYRWRAKVEATMSELDRLTGIKKLRIRGFGAVRFCAIHEGRQFESMEGSRGPGGQGKGLGRPKWQTERFFGSLKSEHLADFRFNTRVMAKREILEYITFYNVRRAEAKEAKLPRPPVGPR